MTIKSYTIQCIVTILLIINYPIDLFSQARVTLNDDPYIVFDNGTEITPIFLVIDNNEDLALASSGTGGNIVSEGEYHKLRWRIGDTTGSYQIPFTTENDVKIPYEMVINAPGEDGTHIDFSTFPTDVMNFPRPSMVTHMYDAATGDVDNSEHVIDRFWINDAMNYTTRPTVNLRFGYDPDETIGNFVTPGDMVAQRFRTTDETWGGSVSMSYLFWGIDNTVDAVEDAAVDGEELYEAWTLTNRNSLLPVTLTAFSASCMDEYVLLSWTTETEQNAEKFIIEKSINGFNWSEIGTVPAQGNSSSITDYSFEDKNLRNRITYYRLRQVDFNGDEEMFDAQSLKACDDLVNNVTVNSHDNGQYQITFQTEDYETVQVDLYSVSGQKVRETKTLDLNTGENVFIFNDDHVSNGVYMIYIESPTIYLTHKILIHK